MLQPSRRTALKFGAAIVGATVFGLDAIPALASVPGAAADAATPQAAISTRANFAAARGKVFRASGAAGTYRLTLKQVHDLAPAKCANDPDSFNLLFAHVEAGPPAGIYTVSCPGVPTTALFVSPIGARRGGTYTQALINRQA